MIRIHIYDPSALIRQVLSLQLSRVSGLVVTVCSSHWPDHVDSSADIVIAADSFWQPSSAGATQRMLAEVPLIVIHRHDELDMAAPPPQLPPWQVGALWLPTVSLKPALEAQAASLIELIKQHGPRARKHARALPDADGSPSPTAASPVELIVIGTSTGGVQALEYLINALPTTIPPVVIVQHMPAGFTQAFAERLDQTAQVSVQEAQHQQVVKPGCVYVAPGGLHLSLKKINQQISCALLDTEPMAMHKPSVDMLFYSVLELAPSLRAYLLTGMGDDGARGLKALRDAGAYTVAQNQASCTVFGMPKEAIRMGGACEVLSLQQIQLQLCQLG